MTPTLLIALFSEHFLFQTCVLFLGTPGIQSDKTAQPRSRPLQTGSLKNSSLTLISVNVYITFIIPEKNLLVFSLKAILKLVYANAIP